MLKVKKHKYVRNCPECDEEFETIFELIKHLIKHEYSVSSAIYSAKNIEMKKVKTNKKKGKHNG